MNQIEVKLRGETRHVEFDQPILWSDLPVKGFYRSRNFWIGCFIGILISATSIFILFPTYDAKTERVIGIEGAQKLRQHGLYWSNTEHDWIKDATKPDFKRVPSP